MKTKINYKYKNFKIAKNTQRKRLYNKILEMLKKQNCIFITMTFNNEILNNTNEKTRELYIKRFLNKETTEYIANRDYGTNRDYIQKINGKLQKAQEREHYHALIRNENNKEFKIKIFNYKYGLIKATFTKNKFNGKTYEEQAEILTNHFLKSTTKNTRLLHSRKNRETQK